MSQISDNLFLGAAQTYMDLSRSPSTNIISGTIAGTVLTVTALQSGNTIEVGQYVSGSGVTANSYITSFGTGNGGVGTYNLSVSSTVGSAETLYLSGNAYHGDPAPSGLGVGPMGRVYVWDVIPLAAASGNVVASASVAAGANAILAAGTGTKSVIGANGVTVIQLDCPRTLAVTITGTSTVTISGYDYYGQPMTQSLTATGSTTKAFWQVSQVTASAAATVAVGTSTALGLPVRVVDAGYIVHAGWAGALAADAGTLVTADMTAPATSLTGDVRGTYVPSSAANGQNRLVMTIAVPGIASGPSATRTGALGVTQA